MYPRNLPEDTPKEYLVGLSFNLHLLSMLKGLEVVKVLLGDKQLDQHFIDLDLHGVPHHVGEHLVDELLIYRIDIF